MRNLSVSSVDAPNIEDLRRLARRRVPDAVFDYIDGGADGEVTLRDNRRSWDDVLFRPKNAVRCSKCETHLRAVARRCRCRCCWRRSGYTRMFHPDGELGVRARRAMPARLRPLDVLRLPRRQVAHAAGRSGISSISPAGGRGRRSLARAWAAGCRVLAVTIDTNAPGHRERDIRNAAPS